MGSLRWNNILKITLCKLAGEHYRDLDLSYCKLIDFEACVWRLCKLFQLEMFRYDLV